MFRALRYGVVMMSVIGSLIYIGTLFTKKEKEEITEKKRKKYDKTIPVVEICLSDVMSALEAHKGGANSIELCSNRVEGGVTPSYGTIEQCVEYFRATNVQVHVLIRPRPGGFYYTPIEFEAIQRDVLAAKMAGADGR